ncbi:uncharacterized protein B0T15DRAFT_25023 [Chaetomium strumarium]|uniref:Uncharacterized protein n=1 Tax=Chaetomium strumarium TaxID=1170767 RepID=A0AAJ0H1H6_9PEZI|nr:hypothetical protein B0T15DRAFT_25023 [Chaetomium strumarium]
MDQFGNASPTSVPTPQSPPAPMALSEFMAQTAPFSDTTNASDTSPLPPGVSKPEGAEELSRASEQDKPESQTTPEEQQQPPALQAPSCSPDSSPPPIDWLATRQQLLPRRNQGKKADWIRGWSQAVSMHGEETYCACSETVESSRGRKGKTSDLAGNVRAMLQRAGSPSNNKPATPFEPGLCRNCSRPASPPPSTGTSLAGEKYGLAGGRRFSKRVSELLMRVRSPRPATWRSKSEHHKRGDSGGASAKMAWLPDPECQPRWATTGHGQKRFLVRPPSQPVPAPASAPAHKARSMDIFPGHARRRSNLYAPSSETSDSDAPRPGLSRSMSRLQRAAALLQRATSRPKD